jgi:hypothetical protein
MTQQIDTAVKAYCNAWLTSFAESNPYHKVSMEADDIAHIKVAIEAALQAAQPAHAHAIDTSPERVEKQAGNVQVPGWLPIESAPKDGSSYLVWAGGVGMAHYVANYASGYPHNAPFSENLSAWRAKATHWMPLPAAPSTKEGQQ